MASLLWVSGCLLKLIGCVWRAAGARSAAVTSCVGGQLLT